MTRDEKLESAAVADAEAKIAIGMLEDVARRLTAMVGASHDATQSADDALIQARIVHAKVGIVQRTVRRIPS